MITKAGMESSHIRETFDHFQSAESSRKQWKVRRSALLEAKCLLLEAKVTLSARIWQGELL